MTMHITMDKELTPADVRGEIRNQVKAFKALYTPELLRDMFADCCDEYRQFILKCGRVITCELSVYQGGNYGDIIAHYQVKMIIDCYTEMYKILFYINQDGEIHDETICLPNGKTRKLWHVDVFKLQ